MRLFTVLLCLIHLSQSVIWPLNQLFILEGEGFLAYHIPDNRNFGDLKRCVVNFMGLTYPIDLESSDDYVGALKSGEKIRRFSKNNCGIRVENVTKNSNGKWILIANGTSFTEENAIVDIIVLSKPDDPPAVTNLTVLTSDSVTIECPFMENEEYCEMINARNNVFEDKCSASASNRIHERSWTCRSLIRGAQELRVNHFNIDFKKEPIDHKKRVFEDEYSVVLSCFDNTFTNCIANGPNDKMLLLHEGLVSKKYSSFDTNRKSGVCSLELRKPIDQSDIGVWRIIDVSNVKNKRGCIFKVNETSPFFDVTSSSDIRQTIDVNIAKTSKVNLACEYPGEIEYCFIQDPELNLEYLDRYKLKNAQDLGLCDFDVTPKAGEWVCGMKALNSREITQAYYNVSKWETPYR